MSSSLRMVHLLGRKRRKESLKMTVGLAFENVYILKIVATPHWIEIERSLKYYSQTQRLLKCCFLFQTILFLFFSCSKMKFFKLFISILTADIYCLYRFSIKKKVWFLISVLVVDTFFWVSQLQTHLYSNLPQFPTWKTNIRMGLIHVFLVTSMW